MNDLKNFENLIDEWKNNEYYKKSALINKMFFNNIENYYLQARFDSRKDFYKKALVINDRDIKYLKSYNTIVAIIYKNKYFYAFGGYSQTTARHINEFLKQNDFDYMSKKELEESKIIEK